MKHLILIGLILSMVVLGGCDNINYDGKRIPVTIDPSCSPDNYNSGRHSLTCEQFCDDLDMKCLGFNGKGCNVVTGETQYMCQDYKTDEVHIFVPR